MTNLTELHQSGQSTWLNYLRNNFIRSGELADKIRLGIQGVTANAEVYERAIAGSSDYDEAIRRAVAEGTPARLIHQSLMVDDIQRAADVLHPVYEGSNRLDGFVSFELEPAVFTDVTTAVAEIRHVMHLIDRNNVMVEVPATPVGIDIIRALTVDGISVNATHLFSVTDFEKVAQSYLDGISEYISNHSVWHAAPTAVASFSLSSLDSAIDGELIKRGRPDLTGKTAIAMAKVIYERNKSLFSTPEWVKLSAKGARPLRPKWTRVTPRDFSFPEDYYVNNLVGPDTVITFSPVSLSKFLRQGAVEKTLADGLESAQAHLAELTAIGIDLDKISAQLKQKYLTASDQRFQALVGAVMLKRDQLDVEWRPMVADYGNEEPTIEKALQNLCRQKIVCRIWSHDYTVWKPKPTEITNRMGWLHIMDTMAEKVDRMVSIKNRVIAEGYSHALLLGMGGSSLAPELFQKTLGRPSRPANMPFPYLDMVVVDTTDADAIRAAEAAVDLTKTLVIVSTKSGGTVETLSAFKYFYNRLAEVVGETEVGEHFIGITDPGSKIVDLAARYKFRDLFINDPNIGGRYSALSYFGLVPAALVGVDVAGLLERASVMASNTAACHCDAIAGNMAAQLGTAMGTLANVGRDKLTFFISEPLISFGDWVEQLIAESLGKEGKGILPVVNEPLAPVETYAADRVFVHLRLEGDKKYDDFVSRLAEAGHPIITFHLQDLYDLGGQFFLWEMATAIAGHYLGINPFDQPNVEAAKVKARAVVAEYAEKGTLPAGEFAPLNAESLLKFLDKAKPGDYVCIQAYVQATPAAEEALQTLRQAIHLHTGLATTSGFGPRFLHSTGQLHKGDMGNGLFIQFISDAQEDVAIPDEAGAAASNMSFNVLKKAQALGDAQALHDARRRVISFNVGQDTIGAIEELAAGI